MGHVGYRVATLLRRLGEPVVVVTRSAREDWVRGARDIGMRVLIGDARDRELLSHAGIHRAEVLIAATDQDLINIEITLDARQLRPDLPVVVRLFDQSLAGQFEAAFGIRRALAMATLAAPTFTAAAMGEEVVGSFSLDGSLYIIGRVRVAAGSPLAGLTMQQIGGQYHAVPLARESAGTEPALAPPADCEAQVDDRLTVLGQASDWQHLADTLSPCAARPRRRLRSVLQEAVADVKGWISFVRGVWRNTPTPLKTIFLGLLAFMFVSVFVFQAALNLSLLDAFYFIVQTMTTIGYGDLSLQEAPPALKLYACLVMLLSSVTVAVLYSIITDFIVTMRIRQIMGHQRIPEGGHIIVVGLGSLGYGILNAARASGSCVVAVEHDRENDYVDALRAEIPVIIGDGRVRDTLAKAGVGTAHAIVVATADDAVNLTIGLAAKEMNAGVRTVLRMFDADFAGKVQTSLNIDSAMSAQMIAAPTFAAAALYPDARDAFVADGRLFVILQRQAGDDWRGLRPSQLLANHGVHVLLRRRSGKAPFALSQDDTPLWPTEEVLAMVWRTLEE